MGRSADALESDGRNDGVTPWQKPGRKRSWSITECLRANGWRQAGKSRNRVLQARAANAENREAAPYPPAWLNQSISGASSRKTTVDTSTAPAAVSPMSV